MRMHHAGRHMWCGAAGRHTRASSAHTVSGPPCVKGDILCLAACPGAGGVPPSDCHSVYCPPPPRVEPRILHLLHPHASRPDLCLHTRLRRSSALP